VVGEVADAGLGELPVVVGYLGTAAAGMADADPDRPVALGDALRRVLPVVRLEGEDARRAGHGVGVEAEAPPGSGEDILLVDDDGPIAVAQRREGGVLKPSVGFRA